MVAVRFLVDGEDHAAHLLAVKHDAVGFAFRVIHRALDGRAGDDLAIPIKMVVTLAKFHQRAVLERPLIVKDKLLTVIRRERNKSNLCVFHHNLQKNKAPAIALQ